MDPNYQVGHTSYLSPCSSLHEIVGTLTPLNVEQRNAYVRNKVAELISRVANPLEIPESFKIYLKNLSSEVS